LNIKDANAILAGKRLIGVAKVTVNTTHILPILAGIFDI